MIIINNEIYIMNSSDVATVVAGKSNIIVNMKGSGYFRISSADPESDAYRLTQAIFSDIRAGGDALGMEFTIEESPF